MVSPPHGGRLVQVRERPDPSAFSGFSEERRVRLGGDAVSTVASLADGTLSPLEGFMGEEDYRGVVDQMRLANDVPWTIPVLLTSDEGVRASPGEEVLLVGPGDAPVAIMEFGGSFGFSKKEYAQKVYGTEDGGHPGVAGVYAGGALAVSGKLKSVAKPVGGRFADITLSPRETRVLFDERGWKTVAAFQTRNAPHINHEYLQNSALALVDGLFVNPVVGRKKAGDFQDDVILAAYKALLDNYFPKRSVVLSALRYEMQYAGPREAILHAIMRKNFGCTHIVIGRDHAGVGSYYGPYAAQEIFGEFPDLGISPMFFREFYYCKKCAGIASEKTCTHGAEERRNFCGTRLRGMFAAGETPPKEFMRPEVAQVILNAEAPFVG